MVEYDCCIVVVILDGCNVKTLREADTPVMDEIAKFGTAIFNCSSFAPTVTYTCHASIITGTTPGNHGIVGNFYYDRTRGKVIDFDVVDVNTELEASTIFEHLGGGGCVGEPISKGASIKVSKDDVQSRDLWAQDKYATSKAIEIIENERPGLLVINFPGVDGVGERFGPFSKEAIRVLENDDKLIGTLRDALSECYDDHLLIVTADHGMTSVKKNVNLEEVLKEFKSVVCPSHRFAHIYLWRDMDKAASLLRKDKRLSLVLEVKDAKFLFLENSRVGDLMVAAKPGYELNENKLKGSHGGLSRDEMMVPLLISKREYADVTESNPSIAVIPRVIKRYLAERKCLRKAKELLREVDPSHGLDHVERVLKCSTRLALKYKADVETVRLAAILHDLGKAYVNSNHVKKSVEIASLTLKSLFLEKLIDEEKVKRILSVISCHHTTKPEELEELEEKVLWDCDKLDALGLIGLARCFEEEGWKRGDIWSAIRHLKRDTEAFKQTMHFKETRRLAQLKVKWSIFFIKTLLKEIMSTEVDSEKYYI